MSFNLDMSLLSSGNGIQEVTKLRDPTSPYKFSRYWTAEEREMAKTKEPIMAKPVAMIEKRTLKRLAIESIPLNLESLITVKKWAVGSKLHGYDGSPTSRYLVLAGGQIARQGDYVVKWPDGRFMAFPESTWEAMTTLVGFEPKYER